MKNTYLKTLIAVAVLVALWGAFVYFGRKQKAKTSAAKKPTAAKIIPLSSSEISAFTLQPLAGKAITCVRQKDNAWQLTEPLKLAADSSAIQGFLGSLTGATADEVVDEHPASLEVYGLDPPQETIEISTSDTPAKYALRLGDSTPTGQGVYAQVVGQQRVIMLASYLKGALEKSVFDLRDKQVVTLPSDQINKMSVASSTGNYTLTRNPDGVWDLLLPPPVRADHITVEGLVDELGSASMQSVVEEDKRDLGKYGFSHPELTLHLSGTGGTQTLLVGKKQGANYYAINTAVNCVFTLGSDFLTQFRTSPADLRAKNLFTFPTFDASKITVEGPKGQQVYEQNNSKWGQSEPVSKVEAGDKVENLLDALRNLSAVSFPQKKPTDLAAYGFKKPTYTFQVQYGKKKKTQTVQIAKVDGHIYARRSTDLVPCELSKDALNPIEKALNAL